MLKELTGILTEARAIINDMLDRSDERKPLKKLDEQIAALEAIYSGAMKFSFTCQRTSFNLIDFRSLTPRPVYNINYTTKFLAKIIADFHEVQQKLEELIFGLGKLERTSSFTVQAAAELLSVRRNFMRSVTVLTDKDLSKQKNKKLMDACLEEFYNLEAGYNLFLENLEDCLKKLREERINLKK